MHSNELFEFCVFTMIEYNFKEGEQKLLSSIMVTQPEPELPVEVKKMKYQDIERIRTTDE